jgi:hypothetical protein
MKTFFLENELKLKTENKHELIIIVSVAGLFFCFWSFIKTYKSKSLQ